MSELRRSTPDYRQRFFFAPRMRFTFLRPHKTASGMFIPTTRTFSLLQDTLELKEETQSVGRSELVTALRIDSDMVEGKPEPRLRGEGVSLMFAKLASDDLT
jgi:hypothetical protein